MAGVQDSALTIAVSNAGGLGSLPCAMLRPDALRAELKSIKSQTSKPFNLNFFCHTAPEPDFEREGKWRKILQPYFKEYGLKKSDIPTGSGRIPFNQESADLLAEYNPPVISFHFGLPTDSLLAQIKNLGTYVLASATNLEEAKWLEANGTDAIIAQGLEAGGHRGIFLNNDLSTQVPTFELLKQIVGISKLPIIAAGGISTANDVAKALSLGASAVQIGTAYLLCPETKTSQIQRAAIKSKKTARLSSQIFLAADRPVESKTGASERLVQSMPIHLNSRLLLQFLLYVQKLKQLELTILHHFGVEKISAAAVKFLLQD